VKALYVLPLGIVAVGVGVATGLVLGSLDDGGVPPMEAEIVVREGDGELRRSRERRESRFEDEEELGAVDGAGDPEALRPMPPLMHPDGRPYTNDELRALARGSKDPELRAAAIRALRRVDSEDARTTLQAIMNDEETPRDLQLLAAQMLIRWPHRDHLPGELIEALQNETDPELRRILAQGVGSLRERGVWMREISGMLGEETDPEVRRSLFGAVARTSRDPAAREQLLDVASNPAANLDERKWALGALNRGRPDGETVKALRPLLDDPDPAIRAQALRVLTGDRGMPLATLRSGLDDTDPSVRATALWRGMNHFNRLSKDKNANKGVINATANRAVQLATSDPDAGVRRAGVSAARNLPKKLREQVLAAGRNDSDLAVRLTAYASSSKKVAVQATDDFIGALSSPDRGLRDYAYNQLRRLHGIRVPFQGVWNDDARDAAITDIRAAIGSP
jgi:HEAT repeat protein